MEMSEGMKAFVEKYDRSLKDPKLRDLYELDLSARRDQAAIAYSAEAKGKASIVTGSVRRALSHNIPVDLMYKVIDAPRSEIDAAIAKLSADDSKLTRDGASY